MPPESKVELYVAIRRDGVRGCQTWPAPAENLWQAARQPPMMAV
jgi:hypothetical protein